MFRFVFFVILFLGLLSCVKTETTKISNNVKIVKYLFSDNKEKTIIKKYNKKFRRWFEVSCSASESTSAKNCIDNLEYTKLAKSKMNLLIQSQGADNRAEQAGDSLTERSQTGQTSGSEQTGGAEQIAGPEQTEAPSES